MSLQREVESIMLLSAYIYSNDRDDDYTLFQTSLQPIRPRHLQLICWKYTSGLVKALSVGMERLERLDLEVNSVTPSLSDITVSYVTTDQFFSLTISSLYIQDGLLDVLKSLRIRMLNCIFLQFRNFLDPVESSCNFKEEEFAQSAMTAVPTLAYIVIKLCEGEKSRETYWTVIANGSERRLCEVQSSSEKSRIGRMSLPAVIQNMSFKPSSDRCHALGVQPVTLASLNEDILLNLYGFLSARNLLNVMSTCRRLFRTGLPALLGRPYVFKAHNKSFYDFLSSCEPVGFLSLRHLRTSRIGDDVDIIADIISRAVNLQVLHVRPSPVTGSGEKELAGAMSSLTKLRELEISCVDRPPFFPPALTRLRSPLVRLHISPGLRTKTSLAPLLSNFRDTLEDLSISSWNLEGIFEGVSCPKVTRLTLHYHSKPVLSKLISMFPNVQVLFINPNDPSADFRNDSLAYNTLRSANIEFQAHTQWHSLVSLAVDPLTLYTMGLQSEVTSVLLPSLYTYSNNRGDDYGLFLESLPPVKPRHLQLACDEDSSGLGIVLTMEMKKLERLDLVLCLYEEPLHKLIVSSVKTLYEFFWLISSLNYIKDGVFTALKSLRIRVLNCAFTYYEPWESPAPGLLANMDHEEFARRAMVAAPTLAYIAIHVFAGSCPKTYWTVTGEGSDKRLCEVQSSSEKSQIDQMLLPTQIQSNFRNMHWGLFGM
ncbi:hypothetical protein EIP86_010102 [Pleurotus ostreatoroseus]|nr:hypothetical protein EIP86_010102 [Pleurotus ostreatoroseus]